MVSGSVKDDEGLSLCPQEGMGSEELVQTWAIGMDPSKKGCFMQPQEMAIVTNC